MPSAELVEQAFAILEAAARRGARCPGNESTTPITLRTIEALVAARRVKVRIFHGHFRQIEILSGPAAGLRTAPPAGGVKLIKIITHEGMRQRGRRAPHVMPSKARQPWKPGAAVPARAG